MHCGVDLIIFEGSLTFLEVILACLEVNLTALEAAETCVCVSVSYKIEVVVMVLNLLIINNLNIFC